MKAAMNIFLFKHLLNQLKGVNLGIKKKHKIFLTSEFNLHTTVQWYQEQRNQVFQLPEGNQKMGFLIAQQGKNKTQQQQNIEHRDYRKRSDLS